MSNQYNLKLDKTSDRAQILSEEFADLAEAAKREGSDLQQLEQRKEELKAELLKLEQQHQKLATEIDNYKQKRDVEIHLRNDEALMVGIPPSNLRIIFEEMVTTNEDYPPKSPVVIGGL